MSESRAGDDFSTASILTHVNEELCQINKTTTFATLFMGNSEYQNRESCYTPMQDTSHRISGMKKDLSKCWTHFMVRYSAQSGVWFIERAGLVLSKNDMLLTYTDGVTEARDDANNLFSDKRLAECPRLPVNFESVAEDLRAADGSSK